MEFARATIHAIAQVETDVLVVCTRPSSTTAAMTLDSSHSSRRSRSVLPGTAPLKRRRHRPTSVGVEVVEVVEVAVKATT
jgi:hypothetical protein